MADASKKISAASARSHTRRSSNTPRSSGFRRTMVLVSLVGLLAYGYQTIRPPPPKISGLPGGPPVTASRVKLRDGRYLAYEERGVSRDAADYKIVYAHPFGSSRLDVAILVGLSRETVEDMGIYVVSFDRPGYGESSPDPKRSVKSVVLDMEELADHLQLGEKFYVAGYSMGGHTAWGCLHYVPHRLAGVALLSPVVNYWWPRLPEALSMELYYKQPPQDQWAVRVAHYIPWLTFWWNAQKWFPASSPVTGNPSIYSPEDVKLITGVLSQLKFDPGYARQQGEFESLHRDMIVGFGDWEFDPMDLKNPFFNGSSVRVHLWQGDDDRLVPVELQRYIAKELPWIRYHEVPGAGHFFVFNQTVCQIILRNLLNLDG